MHFSGRHITRYAYSSHVWCQPLSIRLKPRTDYRQRLLTFQLAIDPQPSGLSHALDLEGNEVATAWFHAPLDSLTITTAFEAETDDLNPFQFLLEPHATRLPLVPAAGDEPHSAIYARPRTPAAEVEKIARQLAGDAGLDTVQFVCDLNEWIHRHHEKILRPTGPPWQPRQTLLEGRGACRDLALLFMECCRVLNIPSRFVSGYGARLDDATDHELHAWADVYLPGAGWRGFDPSLGLAITERHLAVAVGAKPEDAAPTTGKFGGSATSTLNSEVTIEVRLAADDMATYRTASHVL